MATTPELHEPQIAAARTQAWQQAGDALLTLEAARTFLEQYGLLLVAPRPLGAPAPSLVEATLGASRQAISAADALTARGLVARLVHEGSAVPLNLLGGPGDLPDFVVSTAAFPFVFTLRGDKGWKRPPETSGAVKVTPLALRIYELIAERGAMAVGEIVPEIGREVTESAVSRALNELWSLLRVIPALQQGEGETLWELTTARFVKAVKAGANAGQPTALSALISLYLAQALLATEEEIASFLSPLTARSRVRDVLHGLVAGRQLEEGVLNGKSVLYIPETLPDLTQFAAGEESAASAGEDREKAEAAPAVAPEENTTGERIRRFGEGGGRTGARNLRGKPSVREGGSGAAPRRPAGRPSARAEGDRPLRRATERGSSPRPARSGREERFPVKGRAQARPAAEGAERPRYNRPWDEERKGRSSGEGTRPERGDRPLDERRPPRRESAGGAPRPVRRERVGGDRPLRREGTSQGRSFDRVPREQARGDRPTPRRRELSPESPEGGHADRGERRPPRREGQDRPGGGGFRREERERGPRGAGFRGAGPRAAGFSGSGSRGVFSRERQGGPQGGTDRPRGARAGGQGSRPSGSARPFSRPDAGGSRPGQEFENRPVRGGKAPTGRPQGRPPARPGERQGGGPGARGNGRGAGRAAPGKSAGRGRPAPRSTPRPRPEDEA